jgi:curved DNA-binding protein CbpA
MLPERPLNLKNSSYFLFRRFGIIYVASQSVSRRHFRLQIMTPQTELEIQGNFFTHPFVELVCEIAQARLSGSLRATDKDKKQKWILYFKSGLVVFAVSNARSSRLFDIMLTNERMSKQEIVKVPNYANDFEFSSFLQQNGTLSKAAADNLFVEQIEGIITDAIAWQDGDWTFSSLMRIRDGLAFEINTAKLLIDYARCLPEDLILSRFRSMDERFSRSEMGRAPFDLTSVEQMVLSVLSDLPFPALTIVEMSAMPQGTTLQAIYRLWIAGLLIRHDHRRAFTEMQVAMMREAKLELKREAKFQQTTIVEAPAADKTTAEPEEVEVVMTVDQYLEQVEKGVTFYDILGVDARADEHEIKKGYFRLARNFHPDRYHSQGGELLKRMQNAFTEIAQAHETLKHADTREMYDYRVRKELAERQKVSSAGASDPDEMNQDRAAENFETGFSLLMDGDVEDATPFLARAAHFAPKNPRYRAYYGKALAADDKQRHKAEAEIQAAIKLDPQNPTFKILLAEFFLQFNLLKRAEGELTRLLAVFPSNADAKQMLARLKK